MKKYLRIGFIILLGLIVYVTIGIVKQTGMMQSFEKKLVDECFKVDVAPGAEDIQYDSETGLVFITADNRFVPHHTPLDQSSFEKLSSNGIYVVDVSPERIQDIGKARKVSPEDLSGFRPHGLYFWNGEDGDKRLFVVNHKTDDQGHIDEVIEIFQIGEGGVLTHLESISFPEMTNPNDVVAVGPRQFYVTNYLRHHAGENKIYAELFLPLAYSSVVYFDGEKGKLVADGLTGANGINISPDKKTLYVNEWTKRKVSIFHRNPDNTLEKKDEVSLPFLADNVHVEENGNLWFAGQPNLFELFNVFLGKSDVCGSAAVKMDAKTKKQETVFASLEGELNASSVASIAGNKLLIGTVLDRHIMICPKPN